MRYWWVNQNQTYKHEVRGSFMWSPKRRSDGSRNQFYDYMREVSPGDIVFSYCDTRLKAIGVVTGRGADGAET
jgi:putative restriction endonuclease